MNSIDNVNLLFESTNKKFVESLFADMDLVWNKKIHECIDIVLKDYDLFDFDLEFKEIQLDLGVIEIDSFEEIYLKKLEEALRIFISNELKNPSNNIFIISRKQTEFDILKRYLTSGYLKNSYKYFLKEIIKNVVHQDFIKLKLFLLENRNNSRIINRLVFESNEDESLFILKQLLDDNQYQKVIEKLNLNNDKNYIKDIIAFILNNTNTTSNVLNNNLNKLISRHTTFANEREQLNQINLDQFVENNDISGFLEFICSKQVNTTTNSKLYRNFLKQKIQYKNYFINLKKEDYNNILQVISNTTNKQLESLFLTDFLVVPKFKGFVSDYNYYVFKNLIERSDLNINSVNHVIINQLANEYKTTKSEIEHLIKSSHLKTNTLNNLCLEELNNMKIITNHAGIVLLAPYLPMLFAKLDLTESGQFKDQTAQIKAVAVLAYVVNTQLDERTCNEPIHKILVGLPTGIHITSIPKLTDIDIAIMNSLLDNAAQQWAVIKTRDALREAFLEREGQLYISEDFYQLTPEPKAYDMLLDSIPWSYKTTKFSWMDKPIITNWR